MEETTGEVLERGRNAWRNLLTTVLILIIIILLAFYWLLPFNMVSFTTYTNHDNFSSINLKEDMQFFPNMRYIDSNISYKINNCTIKKRNDMLRAFDILENLTILSFYPVNNSEEISVFCQEQGKIDKVLFIAGEGGPTNVTFMNNRVLIKNAEILLIKESKCANPNIALHELLHTFGFRHSNNPNNIMFNITSCEEHIGDQIPFFINELYSIPNKPDLFFSNISAEIDDEYLNTQFVIENSGFNFSEESRIDIYANEEVVFNYDLSPLFIGDGMHISVDKIRIPRQEITHLKYNIVAPFSELDKDNNLVILNKTSSHISYTSILDKDL